MRNCQGFWQKLIGGISSGLRNRVSAEDIGKKPLYFGKKPGFWALGFGKDVRSRD